MFVPQWRQGETTPRRLELLCPVRTSSVSLSESGSCPGSVRTGSPRPGGNVWVRRSLPLTWVEPLRHHLWMMRESPLVWAQSQSGSTSQVRFGCLRPIVNLEMVCFKDWHRKKKSSRLKLVFYMTPILFYFDVWDDYKGSRNDSSQFTYWIETLRLTEEKCEILFFLWE